jgi:hypothetical protein
MAVNSAVGMYKSWKPFYAAALIGVTFIFLGVPVVPMAIGIMAVGAWTMYRMKAK